MLSILLCDDDPLFLNELQATITQILPQEQLSFTCCTKGADCMEAVQRGLIPDVAFVDIALPDVDGISVAAQIYQCCPSIPFIFITAYNNRYSQQVFLRDINLCGYVTKPINENFLRVQISRALRKHTENTLLKVGASQDGIYLAATEIFYIESQKHYLKIYTKENSFRYRAKLSQVEPLLEMDFFRIHSSYLVNMAHVQQLLSTEVLLNNGLKLPVSRSMSKSARLKFMRYRGMNL